MSKVNVPVLIDKIAGEGASKRALVQYVRNNKRQPIGVFVALGKMSIGWSRLHRTYSSYFNTYYGDDWDKEKGIEIALRRAMKYSDYHEFQKKLPDSMLIEGYAFIERVNRYYKD